MELRMNMPYSRRLRARLAAASTSLMMCLLLPTAAAAQHARHFEREAIIVLVDDAALSGSKTMPLVATSDGIANTRWILRFGNGEQRNIIALRRSAATSGLLSEGIRSLIALQTAKGFTPARIQLLAMRDHPGEATDPEARALFERLTRAPALEVRGLGRQQALAVKLHKDDGE
jgi:hypothetical protein